MGFESANSTETQAFLTGEFPDQQDGWGTVLAAQANYYWVKLQALGQRESVNSSDLSFVVASQANNNNDSLTSKPMLLCTRRSRLKKIGQQVMVGDQVQIEEIDWADKRGAIAQVFPRDAELDRPPIANVDQIILVFALAEPVLDPFQLSRFLIKAESTQLEVCLCLSKSDLVTVAEQQQWRERLNAWGYDPIFLSVRAKVGLAQLSERLDQKISVVSGPSGVGKSSLINHLIPSLDLRTNEVSGKLGRGRHTTRHVELFELPTGGLLADTPGFNQPELDIAPEDLADCFPEVRQRSEVAHCQFSDCLHRDEPNCAVGDDWERYSHYRDFLEAAIVRQEALEKQADAESSVKAKTNRSGETYYEPRLEAKKYRRQSRRTQQQELQAMFQDMDVEED
jgi:ribosome biogenesis GTPase / thiamine phosphate phosphatase